MITYTLQNYGHNIRNLGVDGPIPLKRDCAKIIRFPHAGLGYANIGGLLMNMGLGYDSDEGRSLCGALTAIMTGVAYSTSATMAAEVGAFWLFKK